MLSKPQRHIRRGSHATSSPHIGPESNCRLPGTLSCIFHCVMQRQLLWSWLPRGFLLLPRPTCGALFQGSAVEAPAEVDQRCSSVDDAVAASGITHRIRSPAGLPVGIAGQGRL